MVDETDCVYVGDYELGMELGGGAFGRVSRRLPRRVAKSPLHDKPCLPPSPEILHPVRSWAIDGTVVLLQRLAA